MSRRNWARYTAGVLLAAALCCGGCSNFEKQWTQEWETVDPVDEITGRWIGTWQSDVNDHHGKLRAIVTKTEDGDYEAFYHATYASVLTFTIRSELEGERSGEKVMLSGETDLGWLAGGVYRYDGWATPRQFQCNYESKHDHGTYTMRRVNARQTGASDE